MVECIFCKIADREIPAEIVYEDEETVAFVDANPQAPTHILIIPRCHLPNPGAIQDADRAVIGRLFQIAAQIARDRAIQESGYRLVVNVGRGAGQTVEHLHVHLLGGREMTWPPG